MRSLEKERAGKSPNLPSLPCCSRYSNMPPPSQESKLLNPEQWFLRIGLNQGHVGSKGSPNPVSVQRILDPDPQ